jgi:putative FmdB family regulatory protein
MPIYEYHCAACGHHLEALQKMSDAPLRKCPACGKSQLRRLVSASRFRLKGSGWYETDFKSDAEKKRNLLEKAEAADAVKADAGGDKSDAQVEAKPAATAEPPKGASDGATKEPKKSVPVKRASARKPAAKSRAAKSSRT